MGAIVAIVKQAAGAETERLLDEMEFAAGLHGERGADRRTYIVLGAFDWTDAALGLERHLEKISPSWSKLLRFLPPPELTFSDDQGDGTGHRPVV